MIRQRSTFSASEFFYAIDFSQTRDLKVHHGERADGSTFRSASAHFAAIWFKRKAGEITVVKGTLNHFISSKDDVELSLDNIVADAKATFDGRYGGQAEFRWNGVNMWAPQQDFVTTSATQAELEFCLQTFPEIPFGYTGWYSIKD
jgi:hypothetical protein